MNTATIKEIKQALETIPPKELANLCLRLARFKKENKELLTYLLFEAYDENNWVEGIKGEMDTRFEQINKSSHYYIKKSVRKILRETNKYIRYSQNKETKVELLLYFCGKLLAMKPSIKQSKPLYNLFQKQLETLRKSINALHEDLQYDYKTELSEMLNNQ